MKKCRIERSQTGNIEQRCNSTHCLGRCSVGVFFASVILGSSAHRHVLEMEAWAGTRQRSMRREVGIGKRAVGNVGVIEIEGDLGERSGEVGERG